MASIGTGSADLAVDTSAWFNEVSKEVAETVGLQRYPYVVDVYDTAGWVVDNMLLLDIESLFQFLMSYTKI